MQHVYLVFVQGWGDDEYEYELIAVFDSLEKANAKVTECLEDYKACLGDYGANVEEEFVFKIEKEPVL